MTKFLLRVGALVLFSLFVGASGVFASTGDKPEVSTEGETLGITEEEWVVDVEKRVCDLVSESTDNVEPLVSNPAEMQRCLTACKGGGAAMLRYCAVFLDPRIKALCIIAAGGSFAVCSGFCYARFAD